jgi:hypothetical protein
MSNAREQIIPLTTENPEILTPDEVVSYLSLPSLAALYQLNARKKIPHIKWGRRVRYLKSEIDSFLLAHRVKAVDPVASVAGGRS